MDVFIPADNLAAGVGSNYLKDDKLKISTLRIEQKTKNLFQKKHKSKPMKAEVQYNDFKGTVAADISDVLGHPGGDDLASIGRYFNLDEERFKIVGLSISGPSNFHISLICVDRKKSTDYNEHIVKMSCKVEDGNEILDILFKRLHIVLHNKFDEKYVNMEYSEEVEFSDFHETRLEDEEE